MSEISEIMKTLSGNEKLPALIIAGLFWLVYRSNRRNDRIVDKLEQVRLEAEENKSDLLLSIQETKACVMRFIYSEIRSDRRKRNVPVGEDRRKGGDEG